MSPKRRNKRDKDITTSIIVPESMLNELDKLAATFNVTRSLMVRNLLDVAISDAKLLNATGAVSLFKYLRDMKEELLQKDKQLREILQKDNNKGLFNV